MLITKFIQQRKIPMKPLQSCTLLKIYCTDSLNFFGEKYCFVSLSWSLSYRVNNIAGITSLMLTGTVSFNRWLFPVQSLIPSFPSLQDIFGASFSLLGELLWRPPVGLKKPPLQVDMKIRHSKHFNLEFGTQLTPSNFIPLTVFIWAVFTRL